VVAAQAGVPQLGASSLKAALDADWDDPAARDACLAQVLGLLDQVEAFIAGRAGDQAAAGWHLAELHIDRPTCPRPWSATAARTWSSSAKPGGSATPAAGSPRTSSPSTSPPGS
jgi:hypothetical protein